MAAMTAAIVTSITVATAEMLLATIIEKSALPVETKAIWQAI